MPEAGVNDFMPHTPILDYKNALEQKGKQCANKQVLQFQKRISIPLNDGIGLYSKLIFCKTRFYK